jgi:hypothetical protein
MTVLNVAAERRSLVSSGYLSVELTVRLNDLSAVAKTQDVTIAPCDADGEVTTTFTVEIPVDSDGSATTLASKETDKDVGQSESLNNDSDTADIQTLAQQSRESDDDVPYYKNYDRLTEVYEKHDTFAEMTEALGVDVTPATVREHMVHHGIHPTSSDGEVDSDVEAQDDDTQSVTIEADGYGLPESVSMN